MTTINADRAERAHQRISDDDTIETGIIDMLADLRHLCDREGLDYRDLNRLGYWNYAEEVAEGLEDRT